MFVVVSMTVAVSVTEPPVVTVEGCGGESDTDVPCVVTGAFAVTVTPDPHCDGSYVLETPR